LAVAFHFALEAEDARVAAGYFGRGLVAGFCLEACGSGGGEHVVGFDGSFYI
jgi:hypothetical protein